MGGFPVHFAGRAAKRHKQNAVALTKNAVFRQTEFFCFFSYKKRKG